MELASEDLTDNFLRIKKEIYEKKNWSTKKQILNLTFNNSNPIEFYSLIMYPSKHTSCMNPNTSTICLPKYIIHIQDPQFFKSR